MAEQAFECRRCGHCCQGLGGIVMTRQDQRRMAAHLRIKEGAFLAGYTEQRDGKTSLKSRKDGFCVFFDHGCGVHQARPDVCRAWPFFRGNLVDAASWEMVQDYCPGVNPKAGHAEFVRQGREYLRANGLVPRDPKTAPHALLPDS